MNKYLLVCSAFAFVLWGGAVRGDPENPKRPEAPAPAKTERSARGISSDVESPGAPTPTDLVVTSGLQWQSVVSQFEVRNAGSDPIDLRDATISSASAETALAKDGLKLVRGSFELCPGDKALIITRTGIDADDVVRRSYENVYRLDLPEGLHVSAPSGRTSVVDGKGTPLVGIDPTIMDVVGKCCRPATGQKCIRLSYPCNGSAPLCVANTSLKICCDQAYYYGCCFEAGDTTECDLYGCAGVDCTDACPQGACP